MKRKNAFIALLVLSLFLYEAVYGQGEGEQILRPNTQTGDSLEIKDKIRNLEEIVVTGTRTEKTLANTPILTRVISSAQLRQNDFENIMDALEYTIPGLQFNSDPRGDNIRIQGLENKYLLILVDGERLSTTPGGPIDFERLSLSNVKQIEIIKGAASALYGSSAIGMTINIITKTPDRKLEGWAKTRYSRFNDWVLDASVGTAFRRITSQTLFYRNSHNGYDLTPESPQAFTKDPGTNMNIEQKFAWNHKKTQITASGIYYLTEVTNPGESVKNTHYKSNNKTLRVTATQHFADNHQLKASYYGDFYTRNTIYQSTNESEKNATSDIQTLRILDTYTPSVSLQAIAGAEYNWNKDYNAIQYGEEIKTRKVNDMNGFAQVDWQIIPLLNVVGGFRLTHHSVFGNAYSPKINVMLSLGNWKFRGGYSKGFKAPDPTELFSDFMMGSVSHNIGNPDLKAEKSDYLYFSSEYRRAAFNISVDMYQNSIRNKIQSAFVVVKDEKGVEETELRYSNVDNARIRGMELNVDYRPAQKVSLHGTYAYTDAKDTETDLQLKGNIRHAFSWHATYKDRLLEKDFSISLAGHWNSSKINDTEEITTDSHTGKTVQTVTTNPQSAFSLWKLTVVCTLWKKGQTQLDISGGIRNIFNYTDPVKFTTYDPGRRFFGSVLFKF
ncbi:MAG TPA: hypothetical protein DEF88_05390 [Porphyromonadaceae bacterium]|jgi:outer membrane receptor for ferrienterochelin and colicins|nr:hypothetical protein [Porphyromonadaceae bacterium]HBX19859.1 hypothetical protein [Porphyromonadaceae bacterium]HCM19933.1 hypothetical protein [Porphyromonadaceae bacterium]